ARVNAVAVTWRRPATVNTWTGKLPDWRSYPIMGKKIPWPSHFFKTFLGNFFGRHFGVEGAGISEFFLLGLEASADVLHLAVEAVDQMALGLFKGVKPLVVLPGEGFHSDIPGAQLVGHVVALGVHHRVGGNAAKG